MDYSYFNDAPDYGAAGSLAQLLKKAQPEAGRWILPERLMPFLPEDVGQSEVVWRKALKTGLSQKILMQA